MVKIHLFFGCFLFLNRLPNNIIVKKIKLGYNYKNGESLWKNLLL